MRFSRLALIATFALAVLILPSFASADGVTWTFQDSSFDDGGAITGAFNYDDASNTYSDVNVLTTAGTLFSSSFYSALSNPALSGSTFLGLGPDVTLGTAAGDVFLEIFFTDPLTNAGGTDSLFALEATCEDDACVTIGSRFAATGSVTTTPPVGAPEPTTLILLASGLLGLILVRSRA